MSTKRKIPNELRLTPRLKRVIEGASKHVKRGHIKGQWMKDLETGATYGSGWFPNGKKPAVCAVGGLERAAWIELGRPQMDDTAWDYDEDEAEAVRSLARLAEYRVDLFVPYDYNSVIELNDYDDLSNRESKRLVLKTFDRAAGK